MSKDTPVARGPTVVALDATTQVRIEEVHDVTEDIVRALGELSETMPLAKRPPTEDELRQIAQSPTTHLLIARDETGLIIGTLTLAMYRLPSGLRAVIADVAVLPFTGRRGLGTALVAEAARLAEESDATECYALVDPGDNVALRLFERQGFRRMATGLAYQKHLRDL